MDTFFEVVANSNESGLIVPEYLAWDFEFGTSVLESIHSKNKRKLLRKTDEILKCSGIEQRIAQIDDKKHFSFLLEFFAQTHIEKGHEFTLNENWYENRKKLSRTPESLELWQGSTLVGMKMYSYDKMGFYLSHKATRKSYDQRYDLGLILDYLSFLRAKELGFHKCETGKGKNLFGHHLQLSLYEYKVSLGLHLRVAKKSIIQKIKFLNVKVNSPFILLCIRNGEECLFFVHPNDWETQSLAKYKPINRQIEAVTYSQLLKLQDE